MPSNAFVALGGLADGLGRSLQRKQDQKREEDQKHQDLVNNLVSAGITSGKVTDPEHAFKFLMNGGKPGGKDLPPAIGQLIQSVVAHHQATPGEDTTQAPLPGGPSAGSTGGGEGTGPSATSLIGVGSSASVPAAQPARSSNPMGGFKTADELANEEVARRERDVTATTMGQYQTKVNLARKMYSDGVVSSLEEGLQRVGLKTAPVKAWAPHPVGRPVAIEQVPPGALTVGGEPLDRTTTRIAQPVVISMPDGTMETRYEPSGAAPAGAGAGGVDPAKFRERVTEIKAANPGISDEEARKRAGTTLQAEAATTASIAATRDQTGGEAAGTKAGPYDDLPAVLQTPQGKADPESQAAFMTALKAKPKGGLLANNIQQAAEYKMPSTTFTARQIGGLNRATFMGLVKQYDPTFDETKYKPRQDMMTSWRGDGKTAQTMASARKIVNHLADLNKASTQMDAVTSNMAGGAFNPLIAGAKRVGVQGQKEAQKAQEALSAYKTAQNVLALELRRFFATAGSGSQKEIEDWQALSNPMGTTTDRKTFLQTAAKMMLGQVVPKVQQYQETIGDLPPGSQWLDNKDRIRLRSMGVDVSDLPPLPENANKTLDPAEKDLPPEIQGLAPGMKATLPDGRIFYRDANGVLRGGTTVAPKAPKK